jgi:hypothetical protein
MHNCKSTREHFTELLLDGLDTPPIELFTCKPVVTNSTRLRKHCEPARGLSTHPHLKRTTGSDITRG